MQEGFAVLSTIKNNTGAEMADFGQDAANTSFFFFFFFALHCIKRLADNVIYAGSLIMLAMQISSLQASRSIKE
uniref:Uncharacterized protein n=1 Tax=Setaria italica TaxID=4555 RepID=K4AHL2_SETIT